MLVFLYISSYLVCKLKFLVNMQIICNYKSVRLIIGIKSYTWSSPKLGSTRQEEVSVPNPHQAHGLRCLLVPFVWEGETLPVHVEIPNCFLCFDTFTGYTKT